MSSSFIDTKCNLLQRFFYSLGQLLCSKCILFYPKNIRVNQLFLNVSTVHTGLTSNTFITTQENHVSCKLKQRLQIWVLSPSKFIIETNFEVLKINPVRIKTNEIWHRFYYIYCIIQIYNSLINRLMDWTAGIKRRYISIQFLTRMTSVPSKKDNLE